MMENTNYINSKFVYHSHNKEGLSKKEVLNKFSELIEFKEPDETTYSESALAKIYNIKTPNQVLKITRIFYDNMTPYLDYVIVKMEVRKRRFNLLRRIIKTLF